MKDPYGIILHPFMTEKNLFQMEKEENKLTMVVTRSATKPEIKRAFEEMFDVKVAKVNTRINHHGKMAVIKLTDAYSAEDVGTRIGLF